MADIAAKNLILSSPLKLQSDFSTTAIAVVSKSF